ncbi:cell division suppressor protein YneA [Paratissierella segnis]|jgi:hypothetical protein|uniref:LysM peptidoglycan-binding domain-containing protein n=1 Tax=Paratissierella segnis TaxID=2763679 RepID=A0A926IL66_9FIRM|nr:LysM peptidoglycan-binding domain-containing protein [Paratissierella segnis]MBC8589246.1 LysM peptidoglycan-binding domain-containing protein [Paratissierella segnis]
MKKYVIINPRRFFTFLTFVFMFIFIILFVFLNSAKVHSSIYEPKYEEYYVLEGDSLWNISTKYKPEGYDIRKMIYEIKELNNIETGYIYPGESIKVPIYDSSR